jgi:hypothetical protein
MKLAGGTKEKLKAGDEISQAVLGSDGVQREAGAVIEDSEEDALQIL